MQTQNDLQALFSRAFEHHQQGNLPEAVEGYKSLLVLIPEAAPVWALLGTAMNQSSRHTEGILFLIRAKRLDPFNPATYSNLGTAFKESNQPNEAVSCIKSALSIAPAFSDALKNLGGTHILLRDYEAGLMHLDRALKLDPHWPEAHLAKGVAAGKCGLTEKALDIFTSAAILDPLYAQAYQKAGETLISLGQTGQAISAFDRAILVNEHFPEAYLGRGQAFYQLGKYQDALKDFDTVKAEGEELEFLTAMSRSPSLVALGRGDEALLNYEKALALKGDAFDAYLGKAQALSSMNRNDEAECCAKFAVTLSPDHPRSYLSLADALHEQGKNDSALEALNRSTLIDTKDSEAHVNKSIILLKAGDFKSGWPLYAKRLETKALEHEQSFLIHKKCERGFQGKRLWIWCEQGVGDQIFLGGILEDIRKDFSQIIVTLDKRLVPIFSRSFPEIHFTDQTEIPSNAYDGHLPMANLPLVFQKFMGETRPNAYLKSDPRRTQEIRALLHDKGKTVCGLSWESQRKGIGANKSIKLNDLLPLLRHPDFEFINLQYGDVSSQLADLKDQTGIVIGQYDPIDNFSDLDGLASLIDACDMVISTSNSTAHLSGALGKETHLLAPHQGRALQWYWASSKTSNIEHNRWYPSIRVYQQDSQGRWKKPIEEITNRIITLRNKPS